MISQGDTSGGGKSKRLLPGWLKMPKMTKVFVTSSCIISQPSLQADRSLNQRTTAVLLFIELSRGPIFPALGLTQPRPPISLLCVAARNCIHAVARRHRHIAPYVKANMKKMGGSMFLSYGFVSNVNSALMLGWVWGIYISRTGLPVSHTSSSSAILETRTRRAFSPVALQLRAQHTPLRT